MDSNDPRSITDTLLCQKLKRATTGAESDDLEFFVVLVNNLKRLCAD